MLSKPDFKQKNILLCFASEGHKVRIKNDNVLIERITENEDSTEKNEVLLQTSCLRVFSIWIVGHATLTSGILQASKKYNFSIVLFSHGFRPYGVWNSGVEGNFLLRQRQYSYHGTDIACQLIRNKIQNQMVLVRSHRDAGEHKSQTLHLLQKQYENLQTASDLNSILGIEGTASKIFFNFWFKGIPWYGRKPRAKTDFLNTTLDIGYTLLFSYIEALLNLYGFDIYQGVYHRNFYQRKSLVCDIIEPFRCIIDRAVRRAIGLRQLKPEDFVVRQDKWYLKNEKNKEYAKWLLESILEYKEDIFIYVQKYYRCFMRQKDIKEYPVFNIIKKGKNEEK